MDSSDSVRAVVVGFAAVGARAQTVQWVRGRRVERMPPPSGQERREWSEVGEGEWLGVCVTDPPTVGVVRQPAGRCRQHSCGGGEKSMVGMRRGRGEVERKVGVEVSWWRG